MSSLSLIWGDVDRLAPFWTHGTYVLATFSHRCNFTCVCTHRVSGSIWISFWVTNHEMPPPYLRIARAPTAIGSSMPRWTTLKRFLYMKLLLLHVLLLNVYIKRARAGWVPTAQLWGRSWSKWFWIMCCGTTFGREVLKINGNCCLINQVHCKCFTAFKLLWYVCQWLSRGHQHLWWRPLWMQFSHQVWSLGPHN